MRGLVRAGLAGLQGLNAAIYYLIGLLLAVICGVVLIQVLVRFVLTAVGVNIAAPWTEELARYLLVWMIFLGAALGCRKMQLISLDFVVKAMPRRIGQAARLIALGLCLLMFLLMLRFGWDFVRILGGSELSPVMQIPKTWVYWAMPIGAALMIVNTLAFLAEAWLEGRDIREGSGLAEDA